LNPSSVNISTDASIATKFTFPSPVYIPSNNEYALVVISQSDEYEIYIAEMGGTIIGTNRKVSEQPYAGSLFKSQNASTWTPEQNQDLKFVMNKAVFSDTANNNAVFDNSTGQSVKMDLLQIFSEQLKPDNTNINWSIQTTLQSGGGLITAVNIIANTNHKFDNQMQISTANTFLGTALFSTTNNDVSPVIDTKRNSIISVENIINDLSTTETNSSGGDAVARYITRIVTLSEGFDANWLKVYLTANRPVGSSIEVYYKVLSASDETQFDDRPYVKMEEIVSGNSSATDDDDRFKEISFTANGVLIPISFVETFKQFAIKIVMKSSNTSSVPKMTDIRAIALSS